MLLIFNAYYNTIKAYINNIITIKNLYAFITISMRMKLNLHSPTQVLNYIGE